MTTLRQEALWVLRAQCDDREALEQLLRSVQQSLHRFICGMVGLSDVDDIVQDVLVLVCRKLKSLDTPELFRSWVFRIAHRQVMRYLKKKGRLREQVADESMLYALPAQRIDSSELIEEILSLEDVSPSSRAVIVLHFQEELSLAEVAAVLELPIGTVKSRLAYGLAAIRRNLREKGRPYE